MKRTLLAAILLVTITACEWPGSRIGHPEPCPCGTVNLVAPVPGPY